MGNRAWDMITVRNEMQNAMEGKYGNFQKDVLDPLAQSYRDYGSAASGKADAAYSSMMGSVAPLKGKMMEMMSDESKRGYSQDVQNAMFSKQAEALGGAKQSYMKNMGRTLASQGLGGASGGARNRMLKEYEAGHASNLRASSRDVKLADAEAKRADLWNAVQGYSGAVGLEGQASDILGMGINAGFQGLAGESNVAGMGAQNMRDELGYWGEKAGQSQAYSGVKNSESGFWKSFKDQLGKTLGGGTFQMGKQF